MWFFDICAWVIFFAQCSFALRLYRFPSSLILTFHFVSLFPAHCLRSNLSSAVVQLYSIRYGHAGHWLHQIHQRSYHVLPNFWVLIMTVHVSIKSVRLMMVFVWNCIRAESGSLNCKWNWKRNRDQKQPNYWILPQTKMLHILFYHFSWNAYQQSERQSIYSSYLI